MENYDCNFTDEKCMECASLSMKYGATVAKRLNVILCLALTRTIFETASLNSISDNGDDAVAIKWITLPMFSLGLFFRPFYNLTLTGNKPSAFHFLENSMILSRR